MSILLDALKKSEEQRQLGSTPTIHSAVTDQSGGPIAELQWLPLSMLAFSAIVMAWIGWQQYQQPNGISVSESVGTAPELAVAPAAGNEPLADQRSPGESMAEQSELPPGFAVLPPRQDQSAVEQQERLNESFSNYRAEETDTADENPAVASTTQQSPPGAVDNSEDSPADPAQPHVSDPISYWELPQGVRDTLPEIKITVLVFAEEPADRFLLVNGKRLLEKETLGDGVELEEIRREGAVFLYRKYRFLIEG